MTDDSNQVHYQISITSGQAAAFFLVLLVALGLSFFFGMKTGAVARRVPEGLARPAAAPSAPEQAASKEEAREAEPSTAGAPVEEPPLGVPAAPKEEKAATRPEHEEKASRSEPKAEHAEPKAEPRAEPKAAEREPSHVSKAEKPEHGPWYVQVIATQSASTADALAKKLKGGGFTADVSPIAPPGKPQLFRVRVGPFSDHAAADAAAHKVQLAEKLKAKPILVPAGR